MNLNKTLNLNSTDMIKYGFMFLIVALIGYIVYVNYSTPENKIKDQKQEENQENQEGNKITGEKLTVVLYKQKTCPHCVDFMPTWNDLQKKFNELNISHKTVECTEEVCDGIDYIPTIRVYKEDKYTEYKGDRTQKSIMDFISEL